MNNSSNPPVPYEDVIKESHLMEEIAAQCSSLEKKLRGGA